MYGPETRPGSRSALPRLKIWLYIILIACWICSLVIRHPLGFPSPYFRILQQSAARHAVMPQIALGGNQDGLAEACPTPSATFCRTLDEASTVLRLSRSNRPRGFLVAAPSRKQIQISVHAEFLSLSG